ncbi:MAG: hypothetical protein ACTSRZ_15060, partial [Promethearchaeota archaeon]
LIIGCPGENKESINETISVIRKYKPDIIVPTFLVPYPGTKLYIQNKNRLKDHNFENYSYLTRPIPFLRIPEKKIQKFRNKILFHFYFNPIIIMRNIFRLNSFSKIKYFLLEVRSLLSYYLN